MNHKYSTYALTVLGLLLLGGFVLALESSDVDDLCSTDNATLFRYGGTWGCGSLRDITINYTTNNITNLYNNYSLNANNSNYLNGHSWTEVNQSQWISSGNNISNRNSGNVGIGTTTPRYKTHIVGNIGLEANAKYRQLAKTTNWGYSSNYRVMMLGSNSTSYNVQDGAVTLSFGYDPSGNSDSSFNGDGREILFRNGVQFVTPNSANNAFYLANLVLKDGKVGMGTTTPLYNIDVVPASGNFDLTTTSTAGKMIIHNTGGTPSSGSYTSGLLFGQNNRPDLTGKSGIAGVQDSSDIDQQGMAFFTHSSSTGSDNMTEAMRISSSGSVGIGTTSPQFGIDKGTALGSTSAGIIGWQYNSSHANSRSWGFSKDNLVYGDFALRTSNAQDYDLDTYRLYVDNSGNVGIGTTTPISKTQIASDISSYPTTGVYAQLEVTGSTTANKALSLGYNTATDKGFIQALYRTSAYSPLLLNPSGGYVGIGTTSPASKLHLLQSANTNLDGILVQATGGNNIRMWHDNSVGIISSDATTVMSFKNDGTVGIGTTSPVSQLTVDGTGTGVVQIGTLADSNTFGAIGFSTASLNLSNYAVARSTTGTLFNTPTGTDSYLSVNSAPALTVKSNLNVETSSELKVGGTASDGTGKVVCIKSDGNLGTCSNAPNASGVCTCG